MLCTCHGLNTVDQSIRRRLTVKLVGRLGNLSRVKPNPSSEQASGYVMDFRLHGEVEKNERGRIDFSTEGRTGWRRCGMKLHSIKPLIVSRRLLATFSRRLFFNAISVGRAVFPRMMKMKRGEMFVWLRNFLRRQILFVKREFIE